MKTFCTFLICCLISTGIYAQKLKNISVEQSSGSTSFVIKYDLIGTTCMNLYTIEIIAVEHSGKRHPIGSPAASGDIGSNLRPGNGKTVFWDFSKSGLDIEGELRFEFNSIPLLGNDDNAWQIATSTNTCEAYTSYLERFPDGCFKNTAIKKKAELCGN